MTSSTQTKSNGQKTANGLQPRSVLKTYFEDKKTLAAIHFHDLIASTLNKRDDHFYGVWQAGVSFRPGDVVYHQGFLWAATQAHCSSQKNFPSLDSEHWSSVVASQIDQLQKAVAVLQQEVAQLKQCMTLVVLGAVAILSYWLLATLYHLIFGTT